MRKLFLLFLSVVSLAVVAADVTPAEALKQAQQFLQQQGALSGRRASGTIPELKLAGTVSDLYVFNAEDRQGFVIVSNDDCAVPVLGYSETGTLDIQNIPDNMRAWLQGYADEIAWAKQHPTVKIKNMPARAMRAAAVKVPIAPMLKTQWNQSAPYNNLCPEYVSGKRAATGCVATAMAQCMYFTEMRVGSTTTTITTDIPAYTTATYGISVAGISAGTPINWNQMVESYSSSDVSDAATAVAQLMLYCGTSVEMDYGPSSGAHTSSIANALKNYFGYNTETTQYVNRSDYSYANWIEMMYHELAQRRVVCYAGASSGGGHEFVCDGYQGEDFFHINWGWGGMSDNYFKLSALDPDAQGIGGSSSSDGYHYGQEAIIGIQKTTESGEVLNVEKQGEHWLYLNSQTVDKTDVTGGETVTFTYRINNLGDGYDGGSDFDGDIWLLDLKSNSLMVAKTFFIAKGDTKDCVISFTPPNTTATYNIRPLYWYNGYYFVYDESETYLTLNVTESSPSTSDLSYLGTGIISDYKAHSGGGYDIYGTSVKLFARIQNNGSSNYTQGLNVSLADWSKSVYVASKTVDAVIPAGETRDIPFEFDGLDYNNTDGYSISYFYKNSGTWSFNFYAIPGLTTYTADGTEVTIAPTSSVIVGSDIMALDISGVSSVTSVTPNSNPNTLYIVGNSVPTGLEGKNVVQNGVASNITLTDGENFYSPIDFTADNIEFTYNNTKQADGTGGWSTIMLPFDVQQVTADGSPISWFTSSTDSGKDFWVKEFTSDEASTVNFAYTSTMKANTPYIIALPGNHWGTESDLSSKTIKFIGTSAAVSKTTGTEGVTGGNYRFLGSTTQVTTPNIYCLNDAGNSFTLKTSGGSPAFRAYFKPGTFDRSVTMLRLGSEPDGGTTGISNLRSKAEDLSGDYFNLAGQRVAQPTKGLYIVNGKKVLVK